MGEQSDRFQSVPFSGARDIVVDAGRLAARRHIIHGLLEVDVTTVRQQMREQKLKTGESLSFTAFVVACVGRAVAENRGVHAFRDWRNRLILFEDVDVVTLVEPGVGAVALPYIVRRANGKTFRQIHQEIRAAQAGDPKSWPRGGLVALGQHAPRLLREVFYWGLRQRPIWQKQTAGTVILTSVGMFGQGAGWGLTFLPMHSLGLTVGGIALRPALVKGRLENRESLCLTISADHDVVDGAPLARFASDLCRRLTEGSMLEG
jgi:pyruvate/2-oxoglutarate dehydrogenase complex dihydrolipoamide acyltransferase (E2) component